MSVLRVGSVLLLAFCMACGPSAPDGPTAEVADSAGVRVVTWDLTTSDAPVYRVLGSPDLRIGVIEGAAEYSLSRIVDLVVLRDGALVVSDQNAPGISVFDRGGVFVRSIGGRGEGPGEFVAAPTLAGVTGDTVFAWDVRAGRLTAFMAGGDFINSWSIASGGDHRVHEMDHVTGAQFVATSKWFAPGLQDEFHDFRLELDSIVLERMSPSSGVLDTIAVLADQSLFRTVQDGGPGVFRTLEVEPPYRPRAIVEVVAGQMVLGRADQFTFEVRPLAGAPTRVQVIGAENPADAGDIRSHQEAILRDDFGVEGPDATVRKIFLDPLPERLPAIEAVVVGSSGDIWVARAELDGERGYEWLIFASDGVLKGSVRTPPRVRLLAVEPTYVIAAETDELDVPFIVRFPLEPPGGA